MITRMHSRCNPPRTARDTGTQHAHAHTTQHTRAHVARHQHAHSSDLQREVGHLVWIGRQVEELGWVLNPGAPGRVPANSLHLKCTPTLSALICGVH